MPRTTDSILTAEQLAELPDDGKRYELIGGVLHMMSPAGGRHGRIALKLAARLALHVEQHHLGQTFAAETGFLLRRDPDTVRAPDTAYVSWNRLGKFADDPGYLPVAPDLVVEVISPGDRSSDVEAKLQDWLDAGVRVALAVDPQLAVIREYRPGRDVRLHRNGRMDLGDVVPGFALDVAELFA